LKILILAAGRGSRMGSNTDDKPKCLTSVNGKTLLEWTLEACASIVDESAVLIIGGYKHRMLEKFHSRIVVNGNWSETNIMGSLMVADEHLMAGPCIVVYSDILFDPLDLKAVSETPQPAVLSVANWREVWGNRFLNPASDLETFETSNDGTLLTEIGSKATNLDGIQGQFGGIFSFSPEVWCKLKQEMEDLTHSDTTSALSCLVKSGIEIVVVKSKGFWAEFDTISDINTQT
jgi:L-glutamine-phosphate cytidylyltransferase